MNDEQLKKLARITLLNTRLLADLTDRLHAVYEQILPALEETQHSTLLLHKIEQLQAATNELSSSLPQSADELGISLPPAP